MVSSFLHALQIDSRAGLGMLTLTSTTRRNVFACLLMSSS